ncbi:MAG: cytidine deaminase [Anaerolineaceae bacterium]|nr:cytidine deaminase [Anaerolineaceae bacterium]
MPLKINEEQKLALIQAAISVRQWAYVPYSHYPVGAAVLTSSGKIYDGINVESAAFPTTMCAERVAIFKAVSEGEREFDAIAVVTENAGSSCGACRQVMAEFGLETLVLIADTEGNIREETTVSELLPGAFTPKDLPSL